MSALPTLMVAPKTVTISIHRTIVHVMLATYLIQEMVILAMVQSIIKTKCEGINNCFVVIAQISMNVQDTYLAVLSLAVTLWVVIHVAVMMDTHWAQMERLVMVKNIIFYISLTMLILIVVITSTPLLRY